MGAHKILSFSLKINEFNRLLVAESERHDVKSFVSVTSKVRGLETRNEKKRNKNRVIVNDI